MDHDGGLDAREWMRHGPLEAVAMVRHAIVAEPTPKMLRQALSRAQLASEDELTRLVAKRCRDRDYANEFGKTLLRTRAVEE
jgi:hypothetical protein